MFVVDFESNFKFNQDFPPPDHFVPSAKSYPSKNQQKAGAASSKYLVHFCAFWQFDYIFHSRVILGKFAAVIAG